MQQAPEKMKQTLKDLRTRYEEAWTKGSWKEVASFYAEDAWVSWGDSTVTQRRDDIASYLRNGQPPQMRDSASQITTEEQLVAGDDTVLARGSYRNVAPDGTTVAEGNWINVFKVGDGEWRIQWQVINLTPPEAQ